MFLRFCQKRKMEDVSEPHDKKRKLEGDNKLQEEPSSSSAASSDLNSNVPSQIIHKTK